jgi:putative hemolysin
VKDENGLIVGIITLEDIIEEILGEIQDEYDDEQESENYEDGISITGINADGEVGLTIDGDWSLRDMSNEYDIKIPLNDNYSTLAGFLLEKLGNNFPEEGQVIFGAGYSFKILKVENHEILKVNIQQVDGDHISI